VPASGLYVGGVPGVTGLAEAASVGRIVGVEAEPDEFASVSRVVVCVLAWPVAGGAVAVRVGCVALADGVLGEDAGAEACAVCLAVAALLGGAASGVGGGAAVGAATADGGAAGGAGVHGAGHAWRLGSGLALCVDLVPGAVVDAAGFAAGGAAHVGAGVVVVEGGAGGVVVRLGDGAPGAGVDGFGDGGVGHVVPPGWAAGWLRVWAGQPPCGRGMWIAGVRRRPLVRRSGRERWAPGSPLAWDCSGAGL